MVTEVDERYPQGIGRQRRGLKRILIAFAVEDVGHRDELVNRFTHWAEVLATVQEQQAVRSVPPERFILPIDDRVQPIADLALATNGPVEPSKLFAAFEHRRVTELIEYRERLRGLVLRPTQVADLG